MTDSRPPPQLAAQVFANARGEAFLRWMEESGRESAAARLRRWIAEDARAWSTGGPTRTL